MANPPSPIGMKDRSLFDGNDDGLLAEERSTSKPHIYQPQIRNPVKSRVDPFTTFVGQTVQNKSVPFQQDKAKATLKIDINESLITVKEKLDDFIRASSDNTLHDIG